MKNNKLHEDYSEEVRFVNEHTEPLPADLLLKLYAYYKIAQNNYSNPGSKTPLINAFKANALIQAKDISKEGAMKAYIELVQKEIKDKISKP